MASKYITSFFPGISTFTGDTDPNGVLAAERGSTLIRTDAGNVASYLNTDGLTAWSRGLGVDVNGDLSLVGVDQILLTDNTGAALQIGSTGALTLLTFDTVNGAEQVEYSGALPFQINTGGLTVSAGTVSLPLGSLNVAVSAASIAGSGITSAALELRIDYPAGAGPTDVVLPSRATRVTDARIVSGGAGGTVQVQTGAGAAVTDAMVPGALNAITRAASLQNVSFGPGATIRIAGAAGTVAGTAYITLEPT